jgi:hypothetical protein
MPLESSETALENYNFHFQKLYFIAEIRHYSGSESKKDALLSVNLNIFSEEFNCYAIEISRMLG